MDGSGIQNTNIAGIIIEPLVVRDESASAGLGPVPHSGKVDAYKRKAKEAERTQMNRTVLWIGIAAVSLWILTMK
jgi:hypothetical protein